MGINHFVVAVAIVVQVCLHTVPEVVICPENRNHSFSQKNFKLVYYVFSVGHLRTCKAFATFNVSFGFNLCQFSIK